jgi:peroxiredoxin
MSQDRKQWVVVALVVGGLALGAWALSRFGGPDERVGVGGTAPDFRVVDLATGDSVDLRDHYKGRVTLVNIWATWCIPCRQEMPSMQQAWIRLKDSGFAIAAVSVDEGSAEPVIRFAQELGLTFDILHDRSGRIQQVYQTAGVPESFLLDEDGVILKRVIGAHDWNSPGNIALIERSLGIEPSDTASASAEEPS